MQITSDANDIIGDIRQLDCKLAELTGDDACGDEARKIDKLLRSSLNKLQKMIPASQEDGILITEFALEMIERNLKFGNTNCPYIDLIRKIIRTNC